LTGIGQGAAAWMAQRSEDMSCFRRTASGSLRKRTNMVGTSCVWLTLYAGTSRKNSSASNCSMITEVPPSFITVMLKRSGAA
jgi:hypothetical protein